MRNKTRIALVFLTIFIDLVGISIVIPVAAPLFLGGHSELFGAVSTVEYRTVILGLLLATAPLMQFFSAPLLGAYSDRVGRKSVLIFSILTVGLGHLMFGAAIFTSHVSLLFVSRLLAGLGAGNLATANSAMADLSDEKSKARNFGLVGTAVGLGIIFGPFIGGKLTDPSWVTGATLATPLWFAAGLSLVNAILVTLFFQETLRQKLIRPIHPLTGMRNLIKAFSLPNLRTLYITSFLFSCGFNFFAQFFSVFLVAKFGFNPSQIGTLVAYVGIWLAFTQGVMTRVVTRLYTPMQIIRWTPLIAVVTLLVLARVQHVGAVYWLLPVVALSYGVNPPNVTALISNAAGRDSQGEALGLNESMSALSFGLPPLLATLAIVYSVAMPLIFAAVFIFAAWATFIRFHHSFQHPVFHEQ